MKRYITLLGAYCAALVFFSVNIYAQNLVPNPGFEQYTFCPTTIGYFPNNVIDWDSPTMGSPDYFHTCNNSAEAGVPQNDFGYQWTKSGKGMAGIIAWQATHDNGNFKDAYSEYVQTQLIQPLQAGKEYCVTFYVSNGINPNSPFTQRNYIATDQVGIHFSPSRVQNTLARTLSLPYHIINTPGRFITDTANWTKISTTYTARGDEKWMTIGVFTNPGSPPNHMLLDPAATGDLYHAYLYIDDVQIELLPPGDTLFAVTDTTYCDPSVLPFSIGSKHSNGVYTWNNGNANQTLQIKEAGKYWCASYANCRWHIDTFNVIYNPNNRLDLGKEAVNCENKPVLLDAPDIFDSYKWSTGDTTDTITVSQPGKYFLTVTGDCGMQTDTVEVFIQPATPAPLVRDTVVCELSPSPRLTVQGTDVTWYTSGYSLVGYPHQPPVNTGVLGTRVYYLTQKQGKCESKKVPLTVYVKYTPKDELEPIAQMCEKYRDTLGEQLPDVSFRWNTGYNFCCVIPDQPGRFVRTVSNECGSFIDTVNVEFSVCDTCVSMPNIFTPDNDGLNDIFKPHIICPIVDYKMRIFNRWGNLLFESGDPLQGWNGRKGGMVSDMGTYVYVITYKSTATARPQMAKGQVLLLR